VNQLPRATDVEDGLCTDCACRPRADDVCGCTVSRLDYLAEVSKPAAMRAIYHAMECQLAATVTCWCGSSLDSTEVCEVCG